MVNLVRVHSTNKDGSFRNIFNDTITIPPNSQIGLQDAIVHIVNPSIELGSGDEFRFSVDDGASNNIIYINPADEGSYNKSNINVLFNQIISSGNFLLESDPENALSANQLGVQVNVHVDAISNDNQGERVIFEFLKRPLYPWNGETKSERVQYKNINSTGNTIKNSGAAGLQADGRFRSHCYGIVPMCSGSSSFRTRLHTFVNDPNQNGFVMGLVARDKFINIHERNLNLELDDFDYAINVGAVGLTDPNRGASNAIISIKGVRYDDQHNRINNPTEDAFYGVTGDKTISNFGAGGANNDMFEIRLEENRVKLKLYNVADGQFNLESASDNYQSDIAGFDYDDTIEYYCVIGIEGDLNHLALDMTSFTENPYRDPSLGTTGTSKIAGEASTLAVQPTIQNENYLGNSIEFSSIEMAKFFGFKTQRVEKDAGVLRPGIEFKGAIFEGDKAFILLMNQSRKIVILENLNINSYDSVSKQRQNIIATIPTMEYLSGPNVNIVNYDANEVIFIDLNNEYPIYLRNLNIRVVNIDLSPLETNGFNSLSFLIKSPQPQKS